MWYRFCKILLLSFLLHFMAAGQPIEMRNGIVRVKDSIYCRYKEKYTPAFDIKKNDIPATQKADGAMQAGEFKDYTISLPGSDDPIIYITAKVLARADRDYLDYYYSILMLPTGKELFVERRPYIIEYFVDDLANMNVLQDGNWNEDRAELLYEKWQKRKGSLSPEAVQAGISTNYNDTMLPMGQDIDLPGIRVAGNKIYRNDTLIGSIRGQNYVDQLHSMITNDYKRYYKINNAAGQNVASLLIIATRSQSYLWLGDERQALSLVSGDKTPEKMIRVAAKVLLLHHLL